MRFELIDRIVELEPGTRIVATKSVSLAEEYLADHFPTFPILPGVLMLQAMVDAASWLIRASTDFASSVILLTEVRNVTYKSFVKPGHQMRLDVECRRLGEGEGEFAGCGRCGPVEVVKGRFLLRHFNLADENPTLATIDRRVIQAARARYDLLRNHHDEVNADSAA
jgi:3-hydroxyacyl-[acyl-carrier-protein] dehydratase